MPTATKGKKKAAKPVEPEVVEEVLDDDDEVEDLDEVAEEAPTKSKKKGSQEEVTFGASDLAKYLVEKTGKKCTPRELRTLIRKMAREDNPRVKREIKQGNRTRYNWSGPDDPEVKAIIKAFEGGELEADKKAKLDALKESKAAKKAAGEPVGKKARAKAAKEAAKGKKGKKAAAPVAVEEDDEDLDLDDE
jgi:hypothetical protein